MTVRLHLDRMVETTVPHLAIGVALERWYREHANVLRLWAIEERAEPSRRGQPGLRIVVTLAATLDNDETGPFWMAKGQRWSDELRRQVARHVRLERLDGPLPDEFDIDGEGVVVSSLCWRESTSGAHWS
jgi:hypothetical protein